MTDKTMADLRREVARRLRDTLHGREIDTMERGMPELPHMLGIVTIGAISTRKAIKGSILDPSHEFWDDYYKDINTDGAAKREVESAVRSLKDDGVFRTSMPYGDDAGIWYCEVGEVSDTSDSISTTCTDCGSPITTDFDLHHSYGRYQLTVSLDCPECDFEQDLQTKLNPT